MAAAPAWLPTFASSKWFDTLNLVVSLGSLIVVAAMSLVFALEKLGAGSWLRCGQCRAKGAPRGDDDAGTKTADAGVSLVAVRVEEEARRGDVSPRDTSAFEIQSPQPPQPPPQQPQPPQPRLLYLDNIKWMLIEVVVLHHVACVLNGAFACIGIGLFPTPVGPGEGNDALFVLQTFSFWFMGLNQSYFMALFFFISAYFSPSSLDRKGAWVFLQDKFWRLGVPLTVCAFLLYPAIDMAIFKTLQPELRVWVDPPYAPTTDQLWFVFWLLVFNLVYLGCALIRARMTKRDKQEEKTSPPATAPRPKAPALLLPVLYFLAVWIGVSVCQACLAILGLDHGTASWGELFNNATFWNMPMYVTYFVGGILAKRHDWLTAFATMDCKLVWMARAGSLVGAFLPSICPLWSCFRPGCGAVLPSWKAVQARLDATGANFFVTSPGLFFNFFGLAFTVVLLHDAPKYLNFTNRFSRFMARSAYTTYIIHIWFIQLATVSFAYILGATSEISALRWTNLASEEDSGVTPATAEEVGAWKPWVALLYIVAVVNVVVWPLAYALAVAPGLRTML